jgi:hypothetical protein
MLVAMTSPKFAINSIIDHIKVDTVNGNKLEDISIIKGFTYKEWFCDEDNRWKVVEPTYNVYQYVVYPEDNYKGSWKETEMTEKYILECIKAGTMRIR